LNKAASVALRVMPEGRRTNKAGSKYDHARIGAATAGIPHA
jgi:hypothetical protein